MRSWSLMCAVSLALVAGASAQDMSGLAKGLDTVGRERMLLQRASKELFLAAAGVEPAAHRAAGREAVEQFDRALAALLAGDAALGIPAPPGDGVKAELERVKALWSELAPAFAEGLGADSPPRGAVEKVAAGNGPLLAAVQKAVERYEEAAAAAGYRLGRVVNVAGRQRMLCQKAVKEAALVALGVDADANRGALKATRELFERSLRGLLEGDADAELPAASDAAVVERLQAARTAWDEAVPLFDEVLAGKAAPELLGRLAAACERVLAESQKAVAALTHAGG